MNIKRRTGKLYSNTVVSMENCVKLYFKYCRIDFWIIIVELHAMENGWQICVFRQNHLHATDFQEFPVGHRKRHKELSICVLGHSLTDAINATLCVDNSSFITSFHSIIPDLISNESKT